VEGKDRTYREDFYLRVTQRAIEVSGQVVSFSQTQGCPQLQRSPPHIDVFGSPQRDAKGNPDPSDYNPTTRAAEYYEHYVQDATKNLMECLQHLFPDKNPLCVTYFDEAHELETAFWVLLRLLGRQRPDTKMWYVFMGTKLDISYYAPNPKDSESSSYNQLSFILFPKQ
jgi:hypothetical protein